MLNIWLVVDLPLWKMMEFVSWDDEIPNTKKSHVPNHQPAIGFNKTSNDLDVLGGTSMT